ncbi:cytochrome c oxidase accessory protein CcoG [Rhodoblastus acidophilus]|uniref:Cytochrome c oxidase accessory protein CcoG n=1 Tax=Candidatus Rhodoblastus alkanivorans TaxID=2954117 RepID=A0ABS9ZAG4_9HYPH|nr:cytochrome c oxidase accessory protein CcoG [Candidatus Rhodoblastus alkanivorans]MCI4677817.1 cytochrome c oxidase accessory protein CcoG [Candidatus Rhodoblastus alkanivorans]MCI4684685.1 cytochrome c oxidase accessory protein CcoG [Candidatus Rhodoblastus alkanivorans]MDI4642007.1 cytochrome c oxidase accessory protein CcoG [Rhodoblastus acidophilus]
MSAIPQSGDKKPAPAASGSEEFALYESRKQIYPQSVSGRFRNIKWILLAVGMAVYYFLPFARWSRGPDLPSQAVLVDLTNGRFYFFGIEIWPQEVYYFTGLLILAAFTLFLMNAVAGRIWCGYLCPQTVWTDLFLLIERWTQGDRRDRLKKAKQPWTLETIAEAILKHSLWLMIAWWTGGAWVLYFADAPTLVKQLATFQAPTTAYVWIIILTSTTYLLAGFAREQVCLYMCPWPRIQAALTDEYALNVTYRVDRGEPRGSVKKAKVLREAGKPAGDCVDCNQCVAVCPTGVDIRNGLDMGCIQCGLCIDACDNVMRKINRPTGLIGYDTDINVQRRAEGLPALKARIVRPRTIIYVVLILAVASAMGFKLATRGSLGVDVMHDRNPIFINLSDGSVRNVYTVRILNPKGYEREFNLSLAGLPQARLSVMDEPVGGPAGVPIVAPPNQTLELRVTVTAPPDAHLPQSTPIQMVLTDAKTGETVKKNDYFKAP